MAMYEYVECLAYVLLYCSYNNSHGGREVQSICSTEWARYSCGEVVDPVLQTVPICPCHEPWKPQSVVHARISTQNQEEELVQGKKDQGWVKNRG